MTDVEYPLEHQQSLASAKNSRIAVQAGDVGVRAFVAAIGDSRALPCPMLSTRLTLISLGGRPGTARATRACGRAPPNSDRG